ncbi:hypothetical protein Vadar_026185 [Vaccinium darrowii]|uniref:Uncharacterized protein n=1 Tax=Vaccinium darrowii TaxID=229202 RepID=A0ACB7Y3F0_9ERIC|nr:hypothetical protein Vadar_026185 [Vaccinium darrowii]
MGWSKNVVCALAILFFLEAYGIISLFHYVPSVTYLSNKVYLGAKSIIQSKTPPSDPFANAINQTPPHHLSFMNDLQGRPLFVFGDSTVDAGNFNITKFPYGLDAPENFPKRFSNHYSIADHLAVKMQTPIPRAFNSLGVDELKKNVNINFASGGCGLLPTTHPLECTTFADQVIQFQTSTTKNEDLGRSVFFISVGANDFVFSFNGKDSEKFAVGLVGRLETYLKALYSCGGARIFIVNNIAPVGCIPDKRNRTTNECDEVLNKSIHVYNKLLVQTLKKFKNEHDVLMYLADSDKMYSEIRKARLSFGFTEIYKPCCGEWEPLMRMFWCDETARYCDRRTEFLFFDGAHTTHEANRIFVEHCFAANLEEDCFRQEQDVVNIDLQATLEVGRRLGVAFGEKDVHNIKKMIELEAKDLAILQRGSST